MLPIKRTIQLAVLCVPPIALVTSKAACQRSSASTEIVFAKTDLVASITTEEKKGEQLFYSQSFVDSRHRHVQLSGSIYGVVNAAKIIGCQVKIDTMLVDRYSGNVGKKLIGQTQSTYTSSSEFALTRQLAGALAVANGIPIQLRNSPSFACSNLASCSFSWIEVRAEGRIMKERTTADDLDGYDGVVTTFDGLVDHLELPVSSPEAGKELIAKFQDLARVCGT